MKAFLKKTKDACLSRRGMGTVTTVLVLVIMILFNVLTFSLVNTYGWYLTTGDEMDFSLSETFSSAIAPVRAGGEKVRILFCMPKEELAAHATGAFLAGTAEQLERDHSDLYEISYVNIVTKRDQNGTLVDLSKYTENGEEEPLPLYKTSVIFEQGARYRVLTTANFSDFFTLNAKQEPVAYNGEEIFLAMSLWVLTDEHPTAYFTASHSEIVDVAFTRLLAAAGYAIATVDLSREDVPKDCDLLVISNPRSDFERGRDETVLSEMKRLRDYANAGGDLFVSLDPLLKKPLPVLESFLAEYGVSVSRSEIDGKMQTNVVKDTSLGITADGFTMIGAYADSAIAETVFATVKNYREGGVFFSSASAITVDPTHEGAASLVVTSPRSETYVGTERTDASGSYTVAAEGRRVTDGATSSLFLTGTIYMTGTDALLTNTYSNREFFFGVLEHVFGNENPMPYGASMILTDTALMENLTQSSIRLYSVLVALPAVALLVAGVVVLRRRRFR